MDSSVDNKIDNKSEIDMDVMMLDSADIFASIKVTGLQKDMILWYFDKNLDVLTNTDDFDRTLNGISCLRILLCKYGGDYSIQQWCQYWISWHQTVVERYAAQLMSCSTFYTSDTKALQIIFTVNSILQKSLDLNVLKVSPLAEFATKLENYIEPEDGQDENIHPNFVVSVYTGEESYVYTGEDSD